MIFLFFWVSNHLVKSISCLSLRNCIGSMDKLLTEEGTENFIQLKSGTHALNWLWLEFGFSKASTYHGIWDVSTFKELLTANNSAWDWERNSERVECICVCVCSGSKMRGCFLKTSESHDRVNCHNMCFFVSANKYLVPFLDQSPECI